MPMLAPPSPPALRVALDDDDRHRRLRFRLFLVAVSALTVLATVWLMTLGPIPGVLGVLTAKHILVAILVMGLGVDSRMRWPANGPGPQQPPY